MIREVVITPGSSSWWLLTLSPLIYFDRIRIAASDLREIHQQEGLSTYHNAVAQVLGSIEKTQEEECFIADPSLPKRGESPKILKPKGSGLEIRNKIIGVRLCHGTKDVL